MQRIHEWDMDRMPEELQTLVGYPDWNRFELYAIGTEAALWFTEWFDGAEVGLWIAEEHRHSHGLVKQLDQALRQALEAWPVVIAYTQQPRVLRLLARLGFIPAGTVPVAYGGKPVTMYWVTRNSYRGLKHGAK